MFSTPSGMELVMIFLVILVLFGGKKIPELAKGLGSGIKNFKNALKEEDEIDNKVAEVKLSTLKENEKI
jgi:sec-independent protein translocase protein TatA